MATGSRARPLPPTITDLSFRPGTEREVQGMIREIFDDRCYLPHGATLPPGATIVDVGANIGLFSLFADRACGGDCRLICFEPVRETHGFLRENLRRCASTDRVETFQKGLTGADGPAQAEIIYLPKSPASSTFKAKEKSDRLYRRKARKLAEVPILGRLIGKARLTLLGPSQFFRFGRRETVELTNLGRVCRELALERIDFLKVDVEDAELDVFAGLDDDTWARIARLGAEVHLVERVTELERLLRAKGFSAIESVPVDWADDTFRLHAAR